MVSLKSNRKGFTLLETLAAIFILTIGVGGAFALITRTSTTTSIVRNQLIGAYLAQEGLEIVRNIRDTNFLRIRSGESISWTLDLIPGGCANPCSLEADYTESALRQATSASLSRDASGLYSYGAGTATTFVRTISINQVNADELVVDVQVSWELQGGTQRTLTASTKLYNWLAPTLP